MTDRLSWITENLPKIEKWLEENVKIVDPPVSETPVITSIMPGTSTMSSVTTISAETTTKGGSSQIFVSSCAFVFSVLMISVTFY